MDPPRRKSLRFAQNASSTPAKKAKKVTKKDSKRRSIPAPSVPNVANNDPENNNALPNDPNDNNEINSSQQTRRAAQENNQQTVRNENIIDGYGQILQQECESYTLLAFHSENWMELEMKYGVIEHRWIKLKQGLRDSVDDHDIHLETKYRTAMNIVEPYYTTAKGALEDRIAYLKENNINPTQSSSLNFSREANQTINVQLDPTDFYLKPVELESFDGNYAKWTSFREDFVDQVHNNDKIKPVNKLRRLKALVMGQAAVTLGNWQATSTGYTAAWEKLCKVYDNPYLIARAHIEDIFGVPSTNKSTHESLRLLIDTITNAKRQLEEMGVNMIDLIIMHIMCKKLDDRTCADWEMKRSSQAVPQLNQFIDFLEKKARALSNIDNRSLMFSSNKTTNAAPTNPAPTNRSNDRRSKPYTATNRNERYVNTNSASNSTEAKESKPNQEFRPCKLCNSNHGIFRCPAFVRLPLNKRWDKVKEWNLCKNCLNPYHDLRYCRVNLNPCRRCPGEYHNAILCPNFIYNQASVTATVTSSILESAEIDDANNAKSQ